MGVLEARKDAEKVGFPVVGEEKKDTSNIIDYDIRDEQTIEKSSVFDANNDTTTGMANIIPGVNSPKLKLSTSIYVDELNIPSVYEKIVGVGEVVYRPSMTSTSIRNMTISETYGSEEIKYFSSPLGITYSGMKVPAEGVYQLDVTYPGSSSSFGWKFQWRTPNGGGSSDIIWHTYTTSRDNSKEYETIIKNFAKGEVFYIFATMQRSSSTEIQVAPRVEFTISKI